MSFYFPEIEVIKIVDLLVLQHTVSIFSQPIPISIIPPQPFVFQAENSSIPLPNQNMAILAFLLNIYAPLHLPQPMNAMPQDYLKLLPKLIGEDLSNNRKACCLFLFFC